MNKYLNKRVYACPVCWCEIYDRTAGWSTGWSWTCQCVHQKPIVFDSRKEWQTGMYLKSMEGMKEIHGLNYHPKFTFRAFDEYLSYEADFEFYRGNRRIIVDVKAYSEKIKKPYIQDPSMFFLKMRLMEKFFVPVEVWTSIDGGMVWGLNEKKKNLKIKETK